MYYIRTKRRGRRKTRAAPVDGKISTYERPPSLQPLREVSAYGKYGYHIVQSA